MFLLYGFVFALLLGGVPVLLVRQYRAGGPLELVKVLLVLWGILSGAMWLTKRALLGEANGPAGIGESVARLYALPWGTIWVIDTLLLVAFVVLTNRHSLPISK